LRALSSATSGNHAACCHEIKSPGAPPRGFCFERAAAAPDSARARQPRVLLIALEAPHFGTGIPRAHQCCLRLHDRRDTEALNRHGHEDPAVRALVAGERIGGDERAAKFLDRRHFGLRPARPHHDADARTRPRARRRLIPGRLPAGPIRPPGQMRDNGRRRLTDGGDTMTTDALESRQQFRQHGVHRRRYSTRISIAAAAPHCRTSARPMMVVAPRQANFRMSHSGVPCAAILGCADVALVPTVFGP